MQPYLVSIFYKQQPERPTIDQLLFPERLQSGDRFTRVFTGEIEFSRRAFLVTATGFERLPFAPSDENFQITQTLSRQLTTTTWKNFYAL